jgi:acetyl esterase/lipase
MKYKLDSEIAAALATLAAQTGAVPVPERGDWKALRDRGNAAHALWAAASPSYAKVEKKLFFTESVDGAEIELRWYEKRGSRPGSAVVYAHGGGMILSDVDKYGPVVSAYVDGTGVPFLSVNYRLAPESHGRMLAEDTFAGLTWLLEHASEFGVDAGRIATMGDSAGGGIAASVAILARDRKVSLAKQILIYPMLDDRNTEPNPCLEPFLTWTHDNNFTGWSALLGKDLGTEDVSPIASPTRLKDFRGLAPAYIEVGELDIFRDEAIAYGQQLGRASVPIELHVHSGAPHGFERFAPSSKLAMRAMNDRMRTVASI